MTPEERKAEEAREVNIVRSGELLAGRKIIEQAISALLIEYPKLANYPGFVKEIAEYARAHQNTVSPLWFTKRAKELGINLLAGGGGGRSAEDKANSIRSFTAAIINAAGKFGVDLSPDVIAYIAEVADDQNFSMDQLNDVILSQANWDGLKPGVLTANVEQIKQLGSQFFVDMSEETMRDYSTKIASGESTLEAVQSLIRQQAKALNPWMADFIDQGTSPYELMASARDRISKSLGISSTEVDFMDSRFMDMATVTNDKGETRLANSRELTRNIRGDNEWSKTEEASQVATALGQSLAQIFGRSAF